MVSALKHGNWSIVVNSWTIFGLMDQLARLVRHRGGVPMYAYPTGLDVPPVSLVRGGRDDVLERGRHIHDFPALWYSATDGLVYVAAAGEVLDPAQMADREDGVGVFFDHSVLGGSGTPLWPAWNGHPLLFPFLHGRPGGLLELRLPPERRALWDNAIGAIETGWPTGGRVTGRPLFHT